MLLIRITDLHQEAFDSVRSVAETNYKPQAGKYAASSKASPPELSMRDGLSCTVQMRLQHEGRVPVLVLSLKGTI